MKIFRYALDEHYPKALNGVLNSNNNSSSLAPIGTERRLGITKETNFKVEKLLPAQRYRFTVSALNEAGLSASSEYLDYLSPPGVPDPVTHLTVEALSTAQIQLTWNQPKSNGAPILNIRIFVWKVIHNNDVEEKDDLLKITRSEVSDLRDEHDEEKIDLKLMGQFVLEGDVSSFLMDDLEAETDYE